MRNSIREHDHENMAKRKDNEHTKIRTDYEKRLKDIAKSMEYGSHIDCYAGNGKPDEKKEGGEKTKKRNNTETKWCVSKYCKFNSKYKVFIVSKMKNT